MITTDKDLVRKVREGSVTAFAELVKIHQPMLIRLAYRMMKDLESAEDVVQESFIKAYRKINMFEGRSSFKSWIYQITLNTAKNKLRSRKKNQVTLDKVSLPVEPTVEDDISQKGIKQVLLDEVDKLPTKQRTALMLRVFDDLSFKEIAEVMDCPYDTAKANYRHGLMKLRHRFKENKNLKGISKLELSRISHGICSERVGKL